MHIVLDQLSGNCSGYVWGRSFKPLQMCNEDTSFHILLAHFSAQF